MKKLIYLFLLLLPSLSFAQPIEATIQTHWDDPDIPEAFFDNQYHDVWGTTVNGIEYGIITSTDGFHIFDITTEPLANEPVAYAAASLQGFIIGHRDIKTFGNYLYAIADEGPSALQIFDLSGLPDVVEEVYVSDEFIRTAHNLFIDEDNERLYAFRGKDGNNFSFTIQVLSLANPAAPTLMADVPVNFTNCHDGYVRDNIAYLHLGNGGMHVIDLTDPNNPITLGILDNYPDQGYSHSGWLSEDGSYYALCEETLNKDIKIVDVSDFSNMEVISVLNAEASGNQIPHNCIIQGDLLYVSYYGEGFQVFDLSNPVAPVRVAYNDTNEGYDGSFVGAWGVFVLPSGKSVISDMQNGFFAFDTIVVPETTSIIAAATSYEFCMGTDVTVPITIGNGFDATAGVTISAQYPTGVSVTFSENPTSPGALVDVTVTTPTADDFNIIFVASDGTVQGILDLEFESLDVTVEPANLLTPADNADFVFPIPEFSWEGTTMDEQTILQLSTTDGDDFENGILWSVNVNGNNYIPANPLEEGEFYYWRVVSEYACEDGYSDIFNFFTAWTDAVDETFGGNEVSVFPNPASDILNLQFETPLGENVLLEFFDARGKKVKSQNISAASTLVSVNTTDFSNGLYLIHLRGEEAVFSRRVVVQK